MSASARNVGGGHFFVVHTAYALIGDTRVGEIRADTTFGGQQVKLTVVGGPTALIEIAGMRLLTDPTFSPPGVHESAPGRPLTKTEPPAITADALAPIDAVLLSHDQHADNLDPAGRNLWPALRSS